MSQAEFKSEATTFAYISGVAKALEVAEASVSVVSVVEKSTGRRRKLLLTSVVVETRVVVVADQAAIVAARITTDNLNSALASVGLSVEELSSFSIVTESSAVSAGGIAGIAVAGVLLFAASVVWCLRARRSAKSFPVEDFQAAAMKHLEDMVDAAVKDLGGGFLVERTGKFSPLVFGKFDEAATAMEDFLCVDGDTHHANMAMRELAIVSEVERLVAAARNRVVTLVDAPTAEGETAVDGGARGRGGAGKGSGSWRRGGGHLPRGSSC